MPPDKAAAQLSENSEAEEALEIGKEQKIDGILHRSELL